MEKKTRSKESRYSSRVINSDSQIEKEKSERKKTLSASRLGYNVSSEKS